MKLTTITDIAVKFVAAIVFVALVTVFSTPDYPVTGYQVQSDTQITASTAHNSPVVE